MKNILFVRILVFALCLGMAAEVSMTMHQGDLITAESEAEMEHEESSEKEKNSNRLENLLQSFAVDISTNPLNVHSYLYWNSPSLEYQTPPPELS